LAEITEIITIKPLGMKFVEINSALSGHRATLRLEAGPKWSGDPPPHAEITTRTGDFHAAFCHRQTKLFEPLQADVD